MGKAAQRKVSQLDLKKKRYAHGKRAAIRQKYNLDGRHSFGYSGTWYPKCMAWRKGFLTNGGTKFW